jgi:gluconate 2-dehydrogenase gamma chain
MDALDRRSMLRILASAPAAAGFAWTEAEAQHAHQLTRAVQTAAKAGTPYAPKFFTAHEWKTVRVLVDIIIPKDARSGSATDAGVPEFMDFIMADQEARQTAMRGGLAWLDRECQTRFNKMFVDCTVVERGAVLDDIAWPQKATPEISHGVRFFSSFRDLTATGFWTSQMGMKDLQYIGNTYLTRWSGCPDECTKALGVSYPVEGD